MIIYGNLFEPIRIRLYGSLVIIIVAFLIYPYLSIQYELNLVREIKYMNNKLKKKRNKYSNISVKEDDKSWSDVIDDAKKKSKDSKQKIRVRRKNNFRSRILSFYFLVSKNKSIRRKNDF